MSFSKIDHPAEKVLFQETRTTWTNGNSLNYWRQTNLGPQDEPVKARPHFQSANTATRHIVISEI